MKRKNKSSRKKNSSDVLSGTLEITRSGLGYVVVADGSGDVMVRPGNFNTALHGDTVRVKVTKQNIHSGRKEGKILEVVARKRKEFIGTLQMGTNYAFFVPGTEKPMPDFYIPFEKINGAKHKDRVVVKLLKWLKEEPKPVGEVISVLHAEDENEYAMKELLSENGFPLAFQDEVAEEAHRLPSTFSSHELKQRKDFRKTLSFTIDPVDAKDFDDAISFKDLKDGFYEIGVHIADVSHFVEPGTALDEEAYLRATSVYLPDRVNPMLPETISNELCSLKPHEDRLCFSAVFEINEKAEIRKKWLGKTVIHSHHRFTYEDVQEIIDSKKGKYAESILCLHKIAQRIRKERFKHGAINFSSQEVRFVLDKKGKPIDVVVKENKESHQLIEEWMLLANRTVAEYITDLQIKLKKDIPFPYRIHAQPDEQKLKPFIEFAKKFGHSFDISTPEKIADSFNHMLREVHGKPEQHVLEQLGIRTMAKALYHPENIGHFGLGFENYCHFTSPIRRYPDIVAHRVLLSCLKDKPLVDKKMAEKCKHCSERERAAMDCERAAHKYKQVEFLREYIGEEFEAIISGVASFGFWAETVKYKCEGMISVASLSYYDDFRLVEADYALVGTHTGRAFRMGDRVWIRVVAANLEKRQLDFEWISNKGVSSSSMRHKPKTKSKTKSPRNSSSS